MPTYNINGVELTQAPLTWGQSKRVLKLASGIPLADIEQLTAASLIQMIADGDTANEFLSIILTPSQLPAWFDDAPMAEIARAFEDFFGLNRTLLASLQEIFRTRFHETSLRAATQAAITKIDSRTSERPDQTSEKSSPATVEITMSSPGNSQTDISSAGG